jgi:hypothetical protein
MGIRLFSVSPSSYDVGSIPSYGQTPSSPLPNPDPYNYRILEHKQIGSFLLVKIRYPDCTNYEGTKILVYKDTTLNKLKSQHSIDPHFSENKTKISPFARFEPTSSGWDAAIRFCNEEINSQ